MAVYDVFGNPLTGLVPPAPYYADEMADTIQKVQNEITEPCLVFPVTTDIHLESTARQTFDKMTVNIENFAETVKCDFIACLGDLIDGNTTQALSMGYALNATNAMRSLGAPYIFTQGNHDNNPYDSEGHFSNLDFSIKQVFKGFFNSVKNVHVNSGENGTDYYVDFDIGIRLIVLNACNVKKAHNYAYGESTAAWLETALNTENAVLLLEHLSSIESQVWNNNHGTNADAITTKLTAFVNNGGELIQLSGHSHVDLAFIAPWLSVMFVAQKFDKASTTTTQIQKISGYIDVMGSYDRVADTASEDAWTVCVLKPNSKELSTIRFGAGVDRYFHYDPIAPTTLTSKLTSPTWSSSDTSVATVSNGTVTGVASGTCAILAKDAAGNYEAWIIQVS